MRVQLTFAERPKPYQLLHFKNIRILVNTSAYVLLYLSNENKRKDICRLTNLHKTHLKQISCLYYKVYKCFLVVVVNDTITNFVFVICEIVLKHIVFLF